MNVVLVTVAVLAFANTCYGLELRPYNNTAYGMFLGVDANMDGILTLIELEASFDKYDVNGDGVESRHEYTEFVCATTPTLYQLSHYLFDEYDVNGDHHLVKTDYDALFVKMDHNGDQNVMPDEFIAYWTVIFTKYENIDVHGQSGQHGQSACH